jgi:hypothetical protein
MAVIWTVDSHHTAGARRYVTLKRMVDGNVDTAQTISGRFHVNDTKLEIKAKFKENYLAEKARRIALNSVIKDSDLSSFESEVNS